MTIRCKRPSEHRRWGEWAEDADGRAWCRLCEDEPAVEVTHDAPRTPTAGRDASLPADTGDDRPEAWARLWGRRTP